MISSRYAPALCLVVAIALVPVIIHSYAGATIDDGRKVSAIPAMAAGYVGRPSTRDANWGERRFKSHDWFERRYTGAGDEIVMTVLRSFDLKRLYHHPELDVAYGTTLPNRQVEYWKSHPDMPVYVLRGATNRALVMYVLHYGSRFIDDPLRFQIRLAGELLVSRRNAMTLFFVHDPEVPKGVEASTLPSAKLLTAAVDAFLTQPPVAK
jgi:hypothetical protein